MEDFTLSRVKVLWPFAVAFILLGLFLFEDKGTVLMALNSSHTAFWDGFFAYATELGNAFTALLLLPFVLMRKYKWLTVYLLAFALHVVFVHLFKQWLAADALRPLGYYTEMNQAELLQLVEGVKVRRFNSFPSGHTTTVFYLVSFFALMIKKNWASALLLAVGVIGGMSRIYLVQHWFIDTYFGFLFGVLSCILAYWIVLKYPKGWHEKKLQLQALKGRK